jgi:DNA-binding GntR family transcriptional regulator
MIDPTARLPPYQQLAEIIRGRIASGGYPKGSRLPSESDFMEEFEIGRNTARRAVAVLRDEGIVETVATRGTYVL